MTAAWSQWRPLSGGKTPEHGLLAPTDFIPLAEETGRLGGRPSHVLGVTATADGAETSAQVDLLRRLRCDAAQGHYWSPPLPADQLAGSVWPSVAWVKALTAPRMELPGMTGSP